MYWDYVNANGGIGDGLMVEMETRDTQYNPELHGRSVRRDPRPGRGDQPRHRFCGERLPLRTDLAEDSMIARPGDVVLGLDGHQHRPWDRCTTVRRTASSR